MNKLQQIASQPDYNAKASSFSKLIMATFFLAYVYMVVTASGDAGGWIWVVLFLIGGLIVSGTFIAMPLFILKQLFPKFSMLLSIISIGLVFLITKFAFVSLLT